MFVEIGRKSIFSAFENMSRSKSDFIGKFDDFVGFIQVNNSSKERPGLRYHCCPCCAFNTPINTIINNKSRKILMMDDTIKNNKGVFESPNPLNMELVLWNPKIDNCTY
jgi:hypothetical protein